MTSQGATLYLFDAWLPFRDGFCWCLGFCKRFWIIFRTALGWEIWEARKREIEELKHEQEIERKIEAALFYAEDTFFADETSAAFRAGDYERVESRLVLRMQNRATNSNKKIARSVSYFVPNSAMYYFSYFPSPQAAIRFFLRFDCPWHNYTLFAYKVQGRGGLSQKDLLAYVCALFDIAVEMFLDNPFLFKRICLFLGHHFQNQIVASLLCAFGWLGGSLAVRAAFGIRKEPLGSHQHSAHCPTRNFYAGCSLMLGIYLPPRFLTSRQNGLKKLAIFFILNPPFHRRLRLNQRTNPSASSPVFRYPPSREFPIACALPLCRTAARSTPTVLHPSAQRLRGPASYPGWRGGEVHQP